MRIGRDLHVEYPILAVAPMVGQCSLPFRELCRRHGANLVYSEMLVASQFASDERYRRDAFGDRIPDSGPLVVQFCGRDPESFAAAAKAAQDLGAAAVDLNMGCPQLRAKDGGYGAYLEHDLCEALIQRAVQTVDIPVTAKIRLQPTREETVDLAKRLQAAGAAMITLHARFRGRTDARRDGPADLTVVRALVQALRVPVLSNGNVHTADDVESNLEFTGAAGVAVAEALLRNPGLFDFQVPTARDIALRVGDLLDLCLHYEQQGLAKRDDWSVWQKHGAMARAPSRDDDLIRYSNWWPNIECLRQHCKRMLADIGHKDVLQRNTFRKATSVAQLDAYLRARLRLPGRHGDEQQRPVAPVEVLASGLFDDY